MVVEQWLDLKKNITIPSWSFLPSNAPYVIILKICFTPRILKYTDFNPLTYIKTICKVNAIGQRWVNELASFSFSVHYKPGAQNHVADTLSSFPIHKDGCISEYSDLCDDEEIKSILDAAVN